MLKPLRDDLRAWRPSGKSLSAIDAIRAAWASIVGIETARHCTPAEISGTTLVVLTRSGSWSQQLGYLETRILESVVELAATSSVTALRFRVGRLQTLTQSTKVSTPAHVQSRMRLAAALEPAETLDELRERMRVHVARRAVERGPRCGRCKMRMDVGRFCAPCRSVLAEERLAAVLRLLSEMPWLSDAQLAETLGRMDPREAKRAREILATRWQAQLERLRRKKKFERGEPERATAVAYVMLQSGFSPDRLTANDRTTCAGPAAG